MYKTCATMPISATLALVYQLNLACAEELRPPTTAAIEKAITDNFDGRTYAVSFGQDGKPAAGQDVIRFENGLMSTTLCKQFGFEPAPYLIRVEGDRVLFHSAMVSKTQGVNVFDGEIQGDTLKAHADWKQPRWYWTVHVASWFAGKQADPKADLPAFLN